MNYNELLNKMSSNISSASSSNKKNVNKINMPKEDTTSDTLNKIGLEVQRQGGY